ncbi:MAG: type II toxin-antitoxin system VapB family antitoxin [Candidatus Omnitrophica bacterium]|nr:type II toxin-antitoxin system VapB family antitoxin [Candidatus Omnitrophota bacterium]
MKTLIDLDEKLLQQAMKLGNARTKREAVLEALRAYVGMKSRQRLRNMIGHTRFGMTQKDLEKLRAMD